MRGPSCGWGGSAGGSGSVGSDWRAAVYFESMTTVLLFYGLITIVWIYLEMRVSM